MLEQLDDDKGANLIMSRMERKNNFKWFILVEIIYGSEFFNNVSAKDKVQDINLNQLKLKVNDFYKKDEKMTKNLKFLMMTM